MALSVADRKHLMPRGSRKEIADELPVDASYVSKVLNGEVIAKSDATRKKLRRVQVAVARKLRLPVAWVFPETEEKEGAPTLARTS